jgi:hypothetical protein
MQTPARIRLWFGLGVPPMLVSLFFQTVTLAGGNYAGVLLTALALTVIADVCFIQAFRHGGSMIRAISILLLLPTVFVILNFGILG